VFQELKLTEDANMSEINYIQSKDVSDKIPREEYFENEKYNLAGQSVGLNQLIDEPND
jgi:hypothetical protein